MNDTGFPGLTRWSRGFALAGVAVVSLAGVAGCGPDDLQDDPCPDPYKCQPAIVTVQPSYVTALVGTAVTYTAEAHAITGNNVSYKLGYQWRRSSDGGKTWVDIQGATDRTYSPAAVSLADDGAVFDVVVTYSGASPTTGLAASELFWNVGHLAVSARPGIVFEDGEFRPADWSVTPFSNASTPAAVHAEEQVATGGNPGAYRKMVFQVPQGGWARVFYTRLAATYNPAVQGAIYVIDYAEDGTWSPGTNLNATSTGSAQQGVWTKLALEQGGRTYTAKRFSPVLPSAWGTVGNPSLQPADFDLIIGSPCQAGEACPDFSTAGLPMRFGYWRDSQGTPGESFAHGIDNWKVTVWLR